MNYIITLNSELRYLEFHLIQINPLADVETKV